MSERYFDALAGKVAAAKDFTAECPMSFIDDVTKHVNKAMEDFILKQFERHGYSKEEITDLAIAGKIETVEYSTVTKYTVNGISLFEIVRITYDIDYTENDQYIFKTNLICIDLVPPVTGEHSYGVLIVKGGVKEE